MTSKRGSRGRSGCRVGRRRCGGGCRGIGSGRRGCRGRRRGRCGRYRHTRMSITRTIADLTVAMKPTAMCMSATTEQETVANLCVRQALVPCSHTSKNGAHQERAETHHMAKISQGSERGATLNEVPGRGLNRKTSLLMKIHRTP